MAGRELTTLEIRDALSPYLEALREEHGNFIVDVVEKFPNPPVKDKTVLPVSGPNPTIDSKKLKAMSRVNEMDQTGKLRPHIHYLIELGMDLEQIMGITRRCPAFAYLSLEGNIKPIFEFLLDLGIPKSDILTIISKSPQLCGLSLSENLIPTMTFLEDLGVGKKPWAKVTHRSPSLLTFSKQKMKTTIEFLYEMGLSAESIGKILTRCPSIVSHSLENKLRPTTKYFQSLGVDVSALLHRCPQTFGLSLEACLGMIPKWEFFLTMDYPKSELLKFPQYFGYSLEARIKTRCALVKECGVSLPLNPLQSLSYSNFEKALRKKMEKNAS
ncbi:mTERF domain-containing protein 1, mitochondrial [Morella rubra]|uniref:mTERF domain-containing protein 1, mitochondrial n=1 Tax=Morella rubra TaxID=262757 RepID=A0A6A1VSN0_9ROSI|nr:mTERF domain-containing protein 1, mitochondrial [Morella rubra]KAB1215833.1 mTERF domain-containing protein 1, mitochondrial [Morella rubra]